MLCISNGIYGEYSCLESNIDPSYSMSCQKQPQSWPTELSEVDAQASTIKGVNNVCSHQFEIFEVSGDELYDAVL